jgi:hypothetical protein
MSNHKRGHERLEKVLDYLADSILHESNEATLDEAIETVTDPQAEAEYTRSKLREASKAMHNVNRRLSNLGHIIDSNWQYMRGEYQSSCLNCGSTLSFKAGSHQSHGEALKTRCSASAECISAGREASRK